MICPSCGSFSGKEFGALAIGLDTGKYAYCKQVGWMSRLRVHWCEVCGCFFGVASPSITGLLFNPVESVIATEWNTQGESHAG